MNRRNFLKASAGLVVITTKFNGPNRDYTSEHDLRKGIEILMKETGALIKASYDSPSIGYVTHYITHNNIWDTEFSLRELNAISRHLSGIEKNYRT